MLGITTERLHLRQWRDEDLEPFAALNADPAVMEHFPRPLTRSEADALVWKHQARLVDGSPGLYAAELRGTGEFIGFIGLAVPAFEAAFTPCVEVGWRLARSAWGAGYASEGARAVLSHGFESHGLAEIVAFTAATNLRSQAVMKRIGMSHDSAEDFEHPALPEGHRLRPHVLYRIARPREATP